MPSLFTVTHYRISRGPVGTKFRYSQHIKEKLAVPSLAAKYRTHLHTVDVIADSAPDPSLFLFHEKTKVNPFAVERILGAHKEDLADIIVQESFNSYDLAASLESVNIKQVPLLMICAAFGEAWEHGHLPDATSLDELPFLTPAGIGPARFDQAELLPLLPVFYEDSLYVCNTESHQLYEIL